MSRHLWHPGTAAGCLLVLAATPLWAAEPTPPDLAPRQDQQKQVRADAEQTARRVATMLRVLDYYKLDKSAESRLLDEVASTLSGLSKREMTEVIAKLEAAAKATDPSKSQKELDEAYQRHRDAVVQLKKLVERYEAVKSLEQGAARLDKAGTDQLGMYLRASQLVQDARNPLVPPRVRALIPQDMRQEVDEQGDLQREVAGVLKQLEGLRAQLPPEEQERLKQAEALARKLKLLEPMAPASGDKRATPRPDAVKDMTDRQRRAAVDLQEVARALRPASDLLSVLKAARDQIDHAARGQERLLSQTQSEPRPTQLDGKAREWGDTQARLGHAARTAERLLKPVAADLADKVTPAEKAMLEAEEALRKNAARPLTAKPQETAAAALREVRQELDRRIAEAEKRQNDPLAALKETAEAVEQLLQEQKDLRDKTHEADADKQTQRMPVMAPKQQNLAKRTTEVTEQPSAAKPDTKAALKDAAKAMESATDKLQERKGPEAVAKQDEAIKALEEAKKQLAEQIAETEKRREDIANLEDAAKKLEELAKQEGKVADDAGQKAKDPGTPDTKDLAKKQGELTPPTKEVGKQVEKSVPEAAKAVEEAAKHMESAKGELDQAKPKPGSEEAAKATDKLKEAQKAVAKALDQKKAAEIADQAAMKPNEVDPAKAAEQVAKALEQTEEAAKESAKAAEATDLAKLQQQVADQSEKVKAKEAAKPAGEAAKALEKGELGKAVEQQKQALANLEAAAKEAGEPMEGEPKAGEPKAGEPKEGDPKADAPKAGDPKAGDPKAGDPKAGDPKAGAPKAGEPKAGEPKAGDPKGGAPKGGAPSPANAKNAKELAKVQKALLEATQAAAKSQQATQAAQAALAQAKAQAPGQVKGQLDKAGQQLANAAQQLNQGTPAEANESQKEAAGQLAQAMQTLNAAAAAMGQKPGEAVALAPKPGEGQKPGEGEKPGQKPGKSQEKNQSKGTGNRIPDGKANNTPSQLLDVKGDGSFLALPARQREMIRQALNGKLPPEYAALIQQYYVNVARGKPAAKPAEPDKR